MNEGPIPIFEGQGPAANPPVYNDEISPDPNNPPEVAVHPVDPWGGAYIYFGPGRYGPGVGGLPVALAPEVNYGNSIVYSLGPDGLPGNNVMPMDEDYFREQGTLGAKDTDDLVRIF